MKHIQMLEKVVRALRATQHHNPFIVIKSNCCYGNKGSTLPYQELAN